MLIGNGISTIYLTVGISNSGIKFHIFWQQNSFDPFTILNGVSIDRSINQLINQSGDRLEC